MPDTDTVDFDASLDAIIAGEASPPPVEPAAPPAPVAGDAPAEPPPDAPVTSPDSGAPAGDGDPSPTEKWEGMSQVGQLPKRFYTNHLSTLQKETVRLMALMPNVDGVEIVALAKQNLGLNGEPSPDVSPAAPKLAGLEAIDAEIAAVDAELDAKAEEDGVGTTFNKEIKELLDKQQDLKIQRIVAVQREAEQAAQHNSQIDDRNQKAVDASLERYPDLQDEQSEFHGAVMARFADYEALARAAEADPSLLSDPDTALSLAQYEHPDFALLLADEVARERGIAATSKTGGKPSATSSPQGGTPASSPPLPTPKAGPVPLPGSAGAAHRVSVAPADPLNRFKAAAKAGDDTEFDAALDGLISGGAGGSSKRETANGRLVFVS